mgnify:CR=1 FL=1
MGSDLQHQIQELLDNSSKELNGAIELVFKNQGICAIDRKFD